MKKFIAISTLTILLFGVGSSVVYAQGGRAGGDQGGARAATSTLNSKLSNPFGQDNMTLVDLFKKILDNIVIPIGAVAAVLAFIWAGFLYVTAAGDETKIKTAHRALLYAAVGTAVLLGAKIIAEVIDATIKQLQ